MSIFFFQIQKLFSPVAKSIINFQPHLSLQPLPGKPLNSSPTLRRFLLCLHALEMCGNGRGVAGLWQRWEKAAARPGRREEHPSGSDRLSKAGDGSLNTESVCPRLPSLLPCQLPRVSPQGLAPGCRGGRKRCQSHSLALPAGLWVPPALCRDTY